MVQTTRKELRMSERHFLWAISLINKAMQLRSCVHSQMREIKVEGAVIDRRKPYLGDIDSHLPHGARLHHRHGPLQVLQSDGHGPLQLLVWRLLGAAQRSPQCMQTCKKRVYTLLIYTVDQKKESGSFWTFLNGVIPREDDETHSVRSLQRHRLQRKLRNVTSTAKTKIITPWLKEKEKLWSIAKMTKWNKKDEKNITVDVHNTTEKVDHFQ